jgi:Heterokaryon incompatibility protein (HET)
MRSTSSDASWKLIRGWIQNCTQNHRECSHFVQADDWLPTRLIDIGSPTDIFGTRLIVPLESHPGMKMSAYVALSHRWKPEELGKLTSSNIHLYKQAIPFDILTPTFKDAILATRQLGVRYLWIDSLCILQDCQQDWLLESAVMGKVYERSYCNIAATAAAEGHDRLFVERDPALTSPFRLDIHWKGHQQSYYCLFSGLWHLGITKTPLNRRGWVLQERLLSPRTLSFHTQLFWECRELQACETFPEGISKTSSFEPDDVDDDSTLCSKSWRTELARSNDPYAPWRKVVEQFTVSGLTKSSDKLSALSGIAERMGTSIGAKYLAGLWEQNLPFDLLWYIEKGRQANWEPSYRVSPYRGMSMHIRCHYQKTLTSEAPSWSWASVEGRVHFPQGRLDIAWGAPLLEMRAVEPDSWPQYGVRQVSNCAILVSGALEKIPDLAVLPEYMFSMFPGAGPACCIDDDEDLQSLVDLYALPVRAMRSVNGEELLCLILTPMLRNLEVFRRAGLLALRRDELDGFEWATGDWHNGSNGVFPDRRAISIV